MKKSLLLFALLSIAFGCSRNNDFVTVDLPNNIYDLEIMEEYLKTDPTPFDYRRKLPDYLTALGMKPTPVSSEKATIGRILFYDKNLSHDRTISCGSCHRQENGFADNMAFSFGIEGRKTARNSPALANVASFSAHHNFYDGSVDRLFWDNRAATVAIQAKETWANPLEMGMQMSEVVERVKAQQFYAYWWKKAYDSFEPTENQVLECISEFVNAMGSHDTRVDYALESASGNLNLSQTITSTQNVSDGCGGTITKTVSYVGMPGLTESESRGRDLFVKHCANCHSPIRPQQEVFMACNGLDMEYKDQGLGALTGNPTDNGVFKAPSLRNISKTGPYMHDGRFKDLWQVLDFYSDGVKDHPNLHPSLKKNGSTQIRLSATQKQQLFSFLYALNDTKLEGDGRFSNPFK